MKKKDLLKLKENLEANKDLAILSRELGRIDVEAPIDKELSEFKMKEWNRKEVYELFKELRFNKYIEKFNLENSETVEEKDATSEQKAVKEVNAGIYCLNWTKVKPAFSQLKSNNAQGEYYLTDIMILNQDILIIFIMQMVRKQKCAEMGFVVLLDMFMSKVS